MILKQHYIITFANGWDKKLFTRLTDDDGEGGAKGGDWYSVCFVEKETHSLLCHTPKSQLCRIYEYIFPRQENSHQRKFTTCSLHTRRTGWETLSIRDLLLTCGVTLLKQNKLIRYRSYLIFDLYFMRHFSIGHAELSQLCQWVPWERWDKTTNIT